MRHQENERVTDNRYEIESEKRAPMSPKIDNYSAGVGVNCAEQCPKRVVKTNNENTRSECLEKFRDEPHPEFFARADDENGDKQNNQVTLEPKKIAEPCEAVHAQLLSELPLRFKRTIR